MGGEGSKARCLGPCSGVLGRPSPPRDGKGEITAEEEGREVYGKWHTDNLYLDS